MKSREHKLGIERGRFTFELKHRFFMSRASVVNYERFSYYFSSSSSWELIKLNQIARAHTLESVDDVFHSRTAASIRGIIIRSSLKDELILHLINTYTRRSHTHERGPWRHKPEQKKKRNVKKRRANCLYNRKIYKREKKQNKAKRLEIRWDFSSRIGELCQMFTYDLCTLAIRMKIL